MRLILALYWIACSPIFALGPAVPSSLFAVKSDSDVTFTPSGSAWVVLRNPLMALNEWRGERWIPHPFPSGISPIQPRAMADKEGRIWIIPSSDQSEFAYFDSPTGRWTTFPDTMTAYQKLESDPPRFNLRKEFIGGPEYSPDGKKVAYRYGGSGLIYFDGSAVHRWNPKDIAGISAGNLGLGPPWFSKNGELSVTLQDRTTWRRNDKGQWSKIPFESRFPEDVWSEKVYGSDDGHPSPPEGSFANDYNSIALDNLGVYWMVWDGRLYKALPGVRISVFGEDQVAPFQSNPQLREAHVDQDGNAFLLTVASTVQWFVLRAKAPPLKVVIHLRQTSEDSFQARLIAKTKGALFYRWKLDDEPWNIRRDNLLNLDYLPNGHHNLQALAFDGQLNSAQNTSMARFETKIDSTRQVALLVATLTDPNFKNREEAIDALVRQPALAVPALQKSRITANEDVKWWIDAALQECTMSRRSSGDSTTSTR
jgi:hypothetical protein